jgi:hypothetical protein
VPGRHMLTAAHWRIAAAQRARWGKNQRDSGLRQRRNSVVAM